MRYMFCLFTTTFWNINTSMVIPESWTSDTSQRLRSGHFSDALSCFLKFVDDGSGATKSTDFWCLSKAMLLNDEDMGSEETNIAIGIATLCLFIESEWSDISLDSGFLKSLTEPDLSKEETEALLLDGDSLVPIKYPRILLLALELLEFCYKKYQQSTYAKFWFLRALFIQQQFLDELSPKVYAKIESIINELEPIVLDSKAVVNLQLEIARIFIYYGYVEKAGKSINKAKDLSGLAFDYTGVLGKRTKYQQNNLPQLMVKIDLTNGVSESSESLNSRSVPLNDDVRLEKIKLADPNDEDLVALSHDHIAVLLSSLPRMNNAFLFKRIIHCPCAMRSFISNPFPKHYREAKLKAMIEIESFDTVNRMLQMKSLPPDELSREEHRALIGRIIEGGGTWSIQTSALLVRSQIEKNARRTVERAMLQVQAVLEDMKSKEPPIMERLKDFFVSFLPTKREVELTLADFYISLGAIKSALDICLRLEKWEMAIDCYNALQLRHKAKELIEQELQKNETPKLWCLLGDATDDIACYEKAWSLSDGKSARSQRHWANFLYTRKKYKESIEHFEKSLAINSLQGNLWYRLGFAALHEEEWEISAKAYRRYCVLDNDCFEAWNNMARCYCELKQKRRAWRALQEALKIDHSNWRVWDNYMLVSADLQELHEVVRSYHQVLSDKPNHLDVLVLQSLVNNFLKLNDPEQQQQLKQKITELFGRITCQVMNETEVWVLYAETYSSEESVESYKKQRDLLFRAHRSAVGKPGWERTWITCERVVAILDRLLTVTLLAKTSEGVSAIKMAANGSVSIITRCYPDNDLCASVKEKLLQITNAYN